MNVATRPGQYHFRASYRELAHAAHHRARVYELDTAAAAVRRDSLELERHG